jgi:hypothetical protein
MIEFALGFYVGLIGLRIWWVSHHCITTSTVAVGIPLPQPPEVPNKRLLTAAAIIIQSGAVYAACLIILISFHLTKFVGELVLFEAVSYHFFGLAELPVFIY